MRTTYRLHKMFSSDVEVYTKGEKQSVLSELKRTIIQFLEYTSIKIINNADCLVPISGKKIRAYHSKTKENRQLKYQLQKNVFLSE